MATDDEIQKAAASLLNTHGDKALMECAHMVDKWSVKDPEASDMWRRVLEAIRQRTNSPIN